MIVISKNRFIFVVRLTFKIVGLMTYKQLEFTTYCIGQLSESLNMDQPEVYQRLKNSGILDSYIIPGYDVLHTFGSNYLVEELTNYMREEGVLQ